MRGFCRITDMPLGPVTEGEGDADKKEDGSGEEKRKRQTRGGKGLMKAKKKVEPQGIRMWTASRGKKKKVTIVVGLASYGELQFSLIYVWCVFVFVCVCVWMVVTHCIT